MISINSYPKNEGFMRSIGQDDWMIEFEGFSAKRLNDAIDKAWADRSAIAERLQAKVPVEQGKAKHSAALLRDFLLGNHP
jgi:polysaccharide pyruvyl transferase WcaK-like protein